MFPNDSFVERPPVTMRADQRLCLEAVSFCVRTISSALSLLEKVADEIDEEHPPNRDQRLLLYMHCWTVIDQTHMLRTLLMYFIGSKATIKSPLKGFTVKYESFTLMRNKMDHPK